MTLYQMIGRPLINPAPELELHGVGDVFDADFPEEREAELISQGAIVKAEGKEADDGGAESESGGQPVSDEQPPGEPAAEPVGGEPGAEPEPQPEPGPEPQPEPEPEPEPEPGPPDVY